ncbi:RNA-guided endonuclease InsQ/TnpB family protein [Chroococcidiopsis sp.]|uniref:RNA-guided endonuclease InsQ/TnpB family protein n=1 Tax=Chroococcidiopsis sp. TaxID=3088168 RepID=UPI003F4097EC
MLNLTYSYRIYPNVSAESIMLDWLEQSRRVYNYALAERRDWIKSRKCAVNACSLKSEYIIPADTPYPNYYAQKRNLTQTRKVIPALDNVHSQVLQETLARLDKSFRSMQERGFGFPRFKKYGQMRSLLFPQFKANPVTGWYIKLPKIGAVRINLHRPIPEGMVVKQVRVVKKASGWYAMLVLQSDVAIPDAIPTGTSIGIDLGLLSFLATSTGIMVARPKFFVQLQSKLKWLQRQLKDKVKGSNNYRKAQKQIAKLHEHIHSTRREFHFLVAHQLCDDAGMIFAEDLNLKALAGGMLAKHCLDAGWGGFLEILGWVCKKRGVYFAKVDPRGTSQTCPNCGAHTGKKELDERVHNCSECGYITDRDVAAAIVVEQRGLAAVGQTVMLAVEEDCLGVPVKQQNPRGDSLEARTVFGTPNQ